MTCLAVHPRVTSNRMLKKSASDVPLTRET